LHRAEGLAPNARGQSRRLVPGIGKRGRRPMQRNVNHNACACSCEYQSARAINPAGCSSYQRVLPSSVIPSALLAAPLVRFASPAVTIHSGTPSMRIRLRLRLCRALRGRMRTLASGTTHEPIPGLETRRSQSCWDSTILRVPALLASVLHIGLRRPESRPPQGFDSSQKLCDREVMSEIMYVAMSQPIGSPG
jgi:hypothetical protein